MWDIQIACSILSEYTPAEDVEQPVSKDTDSSQQNNVNQYGPRDEAYLTNNTSKVWVHTIHLITLMI